MFRAIYLPVLLLATTVALGQGTPGVTRMDGSVAQVITGCEYNFSSGSGLTSLSFCVDPAGSILAFTSPAGESYLNEWEGYGICDLDAATSYYYYGAAGTTMNWEKPAASEPNGKGTFPLKIVRKTGDGAFTLTQNYAWNTNERIVKVAMVLKNDTTVSKRVYLLRYADINANSTTTNLFDHDLDGAWGFTEGAYGLMLTTPPTPLLHNGIVQDERGGPDPCNPFGASVNSFNGDGSVVELFSDNNLGPGVSYTFNVEYKRF